MKKYIILLICINLFWQLDAQTKGMSQDIDPWVGTWTSEAYRSMDWENKSDDLVYADYKLVIRITKNGNQYLVRGKTIKVKDPSYSSYHRPYTVTWIEGNTMWLQSFIEKDPFTVDYGDGPFVESYSDNTYYYKLTLNNGTLHYSYYKVHSVEYDRNMNYVDERSLTTKDVHGSELDLFNDDW